MIRITLLFLSIFAPLAVPAAEPISANRLVSLYNARPLAESGTQVVELELLKEDQVTKRFLVQTSWQVEQDGSINTLVMLKEPRPLAGTSYLLHETSGTEGNDMSVHIHLPVGLRSVVELSQSEFGNGLLGSNFSYRDLRFRIPQAGMKFSVTQTGTMLGYETAVLEVHPDEEQQALIGWTSAELHIAMDPLFLLAADYFEADSETATKSLRVNDIAKIDNEWIATEMTMQMDNGQWSRISLIEVEYQAKSDSAASYAPEDLPKLAAKTREAALASQDEMKTD